MNAFIADLLKHAQDPATLEMVAGVAELMPTPGPVLGKALRLAAAWIRAGKSIEEVNAIVARYSAEAQALAEDWNA